jgi:hypothetical protein
MMNVHTGVTIILCDAQNPGSAQTEIFIVNMQECDLLKIKIERQLQTHIFAFIPKNLCDSGLSFMIMITRNINPSPLRFP